MKIHWFTPLPPERTDVGNFSERVCRVLQARCDLTVWSHSQHAGRFSKPRNSGSYQVLPYSAVDAHRESLNRADAIFYNLGNNAAFHREIIRIMRQYPGVAILHDLSLFECVSSVYRERLGGDQMFLDLVRFEYGEELAKKIGDWLLADDEARKMVDVASMCPFAKHATLGAWGIISHTEIATGSELGSDTRPRWTLPLPFPSEDVSLLGIAGGERLDMCVFGYIGGPNRRLDEILQAMASFSKSEALFLHIAGAVNPSLEIVQKVKELGLENQVKIHGFLSDEKLDTLLAQVGLVLNLRFPTRGEASGSLLRAWSQGAAVVVTDTGFYGKIPDEVVWKVSPRREQEDLFALWELLLGDRSLIDSKRRNGIEYLKTQHSVEPYVERILEIAQTPSDLRAPSILPMLYQRFGLVAASTFVLPEDVDTVWIERLDAEMSSWF